MPQWCPVHEFTQTRALTAVGGPEDAEVVNFLCGTQSLRTENQVHEIAFDQATETASTRVFTFPAGEIWCVNILIFLEKPRRDVLIDHIILVVIDSFIAVTSDHNSDQGFKAFLLNGSYGTQMY